MSQQRSDISLVPSPATQNISNILTLEQGQNAAAAGASLSNSSASHFEIASYILHSLVVCLSIASVTLSGLSYQLPPVTYDQAFNSSLLLPILFEVGGWVRNLTCEGIEPNPGPVLSQGGKLMVVKKRRKKSKKQNSSGVRTVVKEVARLALRPKAQSESIGKRIGGWVGDQAQKALMWITGMGDYTVKSNSLVSALNSGASPPQFMSSNHVVSVRKREFVGLISTPGSAFSISAYPINPKSSGLFPWLSEMALSFEQFRIKGMIVEFKSTSATAVSSTNTALGSVIIATQYNVLAAPFVNQQQMEAYEFCTSCNPSQCMIHPIECAPNLTSLSELYIDSAASSGADDPRFEYLGTTYVATVGQQAASVIGELWVSYDVDLIKPKLFSGIANQGLTTHITVPNTSALSALSGAILAPFASAGAVVQPGSDFPVTLSNSTMTIPGWIKGTFVMQLMYSVSSTAAYTNVINGVTVLSGAAQTSNLFPNMGGGFSGGLVATPLALTAGSAQNYISFTTAVSLSGNNPGTPVVLNWASTFTGAAGQVSTGGELFIFQLGLNS